VSADHIVSARLRLGGTLNARQRRVINAMLGAGEAEISTSRYAKLAGP